MVADDLTHVRGRDQKLEINGRQKRTGGGSLETRVRFGVVAPYWLID